MLSAISCASWWSNSENLFFFVICDLRIMLCRPSFCQQLKTDVVYLFSFWLSGSQRLNGRVKMQRPCWHAARCFFFFLILRREPRRSSIRIDLCWLGCIYEQFNLSTKTETGFGGKIQMLLSTSEPSRCTNYNLIPWHLPNELHFSSHSTPCFLFVVCNQIFFYIFKVDWLRLSGMLQQLVALFWREERRSWSSPAALPAAGTWFVVYRLKTLQK